MKPPRIIANSALLIATLLLPASALFAADEPASAVERRDLEEVQNLKLEYLKSVTCVSISKDGRFVYASAFNSSVVAVFKRDAATGQIENLSWMEVPELSAAVSVKLSPNDQYATVAAFGANAVSLLKRDSNTGELTFLDSVTEGKDGNSGLNFVIDTAFSADNRYLYTAAQTGLGVYKLEADKLTYVQSETAQGSLQGVRGVVISPDGNTVYAAAYMSNTVGVFRRDKESGKLDMVQILADGQNGAESLAGAFRIACSADGKHVYVSSGRFRGDQAITAFETQPDGKLKFIEEHVNDVGDFTGFKGGNTIVISPDGKLVYAVASLSDQIVRFRRNPASGKLTFLGTQVAGAVATPGAAGLCFSPDGRFVYIADEDASSIVVLKHP
jgi:6-phosphogluconolactonase (cycloisomerase 2 family)